MDDKKNKRRALTAKIHIARKELGLDEETYRAMLHTHTGQSSTAAMSDDQLRTVLDQLKRQGFEGKPRKKRVAEHPGTPHNIDRRPMLQKIEAQLADMGLPWSYADSIAKRITGGRGYEHGGSGRQHAEPGVDNLAWVKSGNDLKGIIAALDVEQEKRNLLARIDELLTEMGKDRTHLQPMLDTMGISGKWERNRRVLRALCTALTEEAEGWR